jgi:CheY-like chemotaxis protein
MSAARAIDRNLSKALVAGLKNVVREGSEDSKNAVAALIDSEASNIFNFLVEEESFLEIAKTHVAGKADPSTRKAFLKQMGIIGRKEFAETIEKAVVGKGEPENKVNQIFVVDDSKMMLKLYQNKLTALGFTPVTFDRPEDAIPQILQKKPNLVITDLNMPNISGLELTREIRKKFSRQEIPILMITTQSDFVEEKDGDIKVNDTVLTKSGINKILHKPFTDDEFCKAIKSFIKF